MSTEASCRSPVLIVHGGAWAIPDSLAQPSREGVKEAAARGYQALLKGQSAIQAVVCAVSSLEDNPVFDAGTGSVLTSAGTVEMDAMVMEGRELASGAVAALHNTANPVQLAQLVMDNTEHTLLVGAGADSFAEEMKVLKKSTDDLVTKEGKDELDRYLKFNTTINEAFQLRPETIGHDTVGAVALDIHGNLACATSTGGITAKRPGRVGDSPIIGSGGYCDNLAGGVSCTGHGEAISKVCLAHHITTLLSTGVSAKTAAQKGLSYMAKRVGGSGGVIVVTPGGDVAHHFTTKRMAWASVKQGTLSYGLDPGEENTEDMSST